MQPMQDIAESMMTDFLRDMRTRYPELKALDLADTRLVSGLPPGRIVETAGLLNAKLIVIGSRGMTGLDHMLLGSVAERVVEMAPGAVVVVKSAGSGKKKKKEKKRKKNKRKMKELEGQQGETNG
jgi:nucleotide-binding universal stress UspA family protein